MSSIEPSPECEAEKPGDPCEVCMKRVGHGGRWHGNLDTYWPVIPPGKTG